MTHICVNNPTIIGSDNGLSPSRCQAIIWTKAGILLIETLGTNFSEILIEILTFSFKKKRLKVSSAKRGPFCLGLNVLNTQTCQETSVDRRIPRFNTLRPRQDGRHFADDILTCIFFNENGCILIRFSLKYVRRGSIDNNLALVQIMTWRRSGDKPLSEPMMIISPTHIGVTRPQWVNSLSLERCESLFC